jgi:prophage endopeptidase
MLLSLLRLIPVWAWALLACAGVIAFQSWRLSSAQGQRDSAVAELATTVAAKESLKATLKLQRQIDKDTAEAFTNARKANDVLRADLAAGRKRVSVNATCVRDTGASSPADAGTPRLTPDAEQARADLELGNEQNMVQIRGLQRFIREVCLGARPQ